VHGQGVSAHLHEFRVSHEPHGHIGAVAAVSAVSGTGPEAAGTTIAAGTGVAAATAGAA